MTWQYLGEVWATTGRIRGREYLWRGNNPNILEWVRRKITERHQELKHWGDALYIRGSYWEYKVQLLEGFLTINGITYPTHSDDKIHVWRRKI